MVHIHIDNVLKKQGKTRYWLIKNTELSFSTVTNLCNNEVKAIHFSTLEKICKLLDCTLDDIITFS